MAADNEAQAQFAEALRKAEENPDDIGAIRAATESAERAGDWRTSSRLKSRWLQILLKRHS